MTALQILGVVIAVGLSIVILIIVGFRWLAKDYTFRKHKDSEFYDKAADAVNEEKKQ